ncbi:MAG: TPR end-of-group domain-containing protein [Acidimicrobiales bacterium]
MNGPSFRIAGIPVRIDLTFFLIVFVLGFGARSGTLLVAWVVIVTGSVLLHELGHALAFRRYGQEPQILLQGMGGLTSGSGAPLRPSHDIVVSLAGPLTGLILLGIPALVLARSSVELTPTWQTVVEDIVFVNLAWSLVNLLPVLPLDGGRTTAALWEAVTGKPGERQVHMLSVTVAGAAGLFALTRGYLFGTLFAGFFIAYNVSQLSAARNARLGSGLVEGWRALGRGEADAAEAAAERALADRPSAEIMVHAMELQAWARLAAGRPDDARAAVAHFPHGRVPSDLLTGTLELEARRSEEGLSHLLAVYASHDYGPAMPMAAAAVARAGLVDTFLDRLCAPGGPGPTAVADFAVHLHVAGRYDEAATANRRALDAADAFGDGGEARVAYNLACSHARAGQVGPALEWLERAVAAGFADIALLDSDPDLDGLRDDDRYRVLRARLGG